MSNFWELEVGEYIDEIAYLVSPKEQFNEPKCYFETASIIDKYQPLTFQAGYARKVYPDFFMHGGMAVISNHFRNVLEQVGGINAEFLRAKLLSKNGELVEGNPYWLLHLLEEVDCIDFANSDLDFWNPNTHLIQRIRRLKFAENQIGNRHLFRPKGSIFMFISNHLKSTIEEEKLIVDFRVLEKVRL